MNKILVHLFSYNFNSNFSLCFILAIFMKFLDMIIHEIPLYLAVLKENIEIIQLLLNHNKTNVNVVNIQN